LEDCMPTPLETLSDTASTSPLMEEPRRVET
jgi:hypothetical protein